MVTLMTLKIKDTIHNIGMFVVLEAYDVALSYKSLLELYGYCFLNRYFLSMCWKHFVFLLIGLIGRINQYML